MCWIKSRLSWHTHCWQHALSTQNILRRCLLEVIPDIRPDCFQANFPPWTPDKKWYFHSHNKDEYWRGIFPHTRNFLWFDWRNIFVANTYLRCQRSQINNEVIWIMCRWQHDYNAKSVWNWHIVLKILQTLNALSCIFSDKYQSHNKGLAKNASNVCFDIYVRFRWRTRIPWIIAQQTQNVINTYLRVYYVLCLQGISGEGTFCGIRLCRSTCGQIPTSILACGQFTVSCLWKKCCGTREAGRHTFLVLLLGETLQ